MARGFREAEKEQTIVRGPALFPVTDTQLLRQYASDTPELEHVATPHSHVALLLAAGSLLACSIPDSTTREPSSQEARRAITALLDSMASSISSRDADAIAARMPSDSSIVYVSDGRPIRGTDLRTILGKFYSGLRSLTFEWDSVQLAPRGAQTWSAISWAHISTMDSIGHVTDTRAIFTWTIVGGRDRWVLALAHKATLP